MPACSLETLGTFALRVDGRLAPAPSTQKARALLVYLVMHRGSDVARERLMELLWPDADPERGRESLRTALHSIRRSLRGADADADALLTTNKSVVRWTPETKLDIDRFAELADRSDPASLSEALAVYRGDFLEGDYENWTVIERERLSARYEGLLGRALKSANDPEIARRLIERNPYEEEPYVALIDAELAAGRRSVAQRLIAQCRGALAELGERPSAEFERRYADLERAVAKPADSFRLPFVGREHELAEIERHLDDASQGRGSLTIICGEPGIGKSTLLGRADEAAHRRGLRVISVQCLAGDPRPFGPWQGVFESLTSRELTEFVKIAGRDVASDVADAIVAALLKPTMLIIDDVQYARDAALEVTTNVMRLGGAAHAVVAASRPEGLALINAALGESRRAELAVGALTRDDVVAGLQRLAIAEDDPLLDALYGRTDGNPLYVISFLDELVKAGTLRRRGNRWEIDHKRPLELHLPKSLTRSIENRLRSRGEAAAGVACALALDADSDIDDVGDALGLDETSRLDALDDLLALGVVVEQSSGPQLRFAHDVIRDVAAQLLSAARRTRVHRAFADSLERSPARNAAIRRARHLEAAGDFIEAAGLYKDAAIEAMELRAVSDASARCDDGLRMLAKADRSEPVELVAAELHRVKAENLVRNGRYKDALAPVVESVRMARAAGDERALIKSLNLRSTINMELPEIDDMLRDADEVATIADRVGDHASAVNAAVKRSWAFVMLEDGEQAIALGRKALALADRIGSDRDRMVAADSLIRAASLWWHFKTAAAASTLAIQIGPRVGWNAEVANLSAAARLWLLVGRLEVAHGMLEQARSHPQSRLRSGDVLLSMPLHELRVDFVLATVLTELGRLDEALEVAERCAKHPLTASEPDIDNTLRMALLDILWRRNQPADRKRLPDLLRILTDVRTTTGVLFGGNSPEIVRAIVSVRLGVAQAPELMSKAIDHSESAAAHKPFDCVRGFAKLAAAAVEAGLPELHARSERLREMYASRHATAVAELESVLA